MGRAGASWGARVAACALVLAFMWGALSAASPAGSAAQEGAVRVPILVYHAIDYSGTEYSVTPEQLHEQCRWLLENGYSPITLGHFWDASLGFAKLPPNPVVLTNDDGWGSAMTFADILAEYGFVATYFVNNVSPLTAEQIWALSQRGGVQAHTVNHADLSGLDYESQVREIAENKTYLEQITGQPVRFLAWPFGSRNDGAVQAAAAAGIVAAFGLGGTAAYLGAVDPYHIPRIMLLNHTDLEMFAAMVGWW